MAEQFHFDPDTYLDMVRAEVPDYEELQAVVADATGEVAAETILDLGTGTGETLRHVAAAIQRPRLIGIDESEPHARRRPQSVVPGADLASRGCRTTSRRTVRSRRLGARGTPPRPAGEGRAVPAASRTSSPRAVASCSPT